MAKKREQSSYPELNWDRDDLLLISRSEEGSWGFGSPISIAELLLYSSQMASVGTFSLTLWAALKKYQWNKKEHKGMREIKEEVNERVQDQSIQSIEERGDDKLNQFIANHVEEEVKKIIDEEEGRFRNKWRIFSESNKYLKEVVSMAENERLDLKFSSELFEEVLRFVPDADFFMGKREAWRDGPESYSKNELTASIPLMEFFIRMNIQITGEWPSHVREIGDQVDFSRNLVCLGGPVSNWYVKYLMYHSGLSLPYIFSFKNESEGENLSEYTQKQLQQIGRTNSENSTEVPNWFISDTDGKPVEVDDEVMIPAKRSGVWYKDYFIITKTQNVYRDAGPSTKCLTLSGCHGFGTRAAARAIQMPQHIKRIQEEVGSSNFQVLGSAWREFRNINGKLKIENKLPEIHHIVEL